MTAAMESAFETLFLDRSPDRSRFDEAYRTLSSVEGDAFTDVALEILPRCGPKPSKLPSKGSVIWFRRDRSTRLGWKFLVAAPVEHSYRQTTWWLATDGEWLETDQSFQRSAFQLTNTTAVEFTRKRLDQLLRSRATRVATWMNNPKGHLNPGVE